MTLVSSRRAADESVSVSVLQDLQDHYHYQTQVQAQVRMRVYVCMYVAYVTPRRSDRGLLRITTTTADVVEGREGSNTNGINQYRGGGGRGGGDGGAKG